MRKVTYLKLCPEPKKKPANRILVEESEPEEQFVKRVLVEKDPWMCSVSASKSEDKLNARGPTYKVDIDVNSIKTRGFLDHGAQVTLVRKELLSAIGEKHGWSLEERHKRNLKMKSRPVGASGTDLGAIALASLDILVEEKFHAMYCRQTNLSGEENCIIVGTNSFVALGFKVFHSNGTEVPAQCEPGESQPSVSVTSVLQVTIEKNAF